MEEISKFTDKCIIVNIPIGKKERAGLYEATRRCWRASLDKAGKADYVLGTDKGKVLCVIKVNGCKYVASEFCAKERAACEKEFGVNTKLCKNKRRIEFEGQELKNDKKYLGKTLLEEYTPGQNPIRYTYD